MSTDMFQNSLESFVKTNTMTSGKTKLSSTNGVDAPELIKVTNKVKTFGTTSNELYSRDHVPKKGISAASSKSQASAYAQSNSQSDNMKNFNKESHSSAFGFGSSLGFGDILYPKRFNSTQNNFKNKFNKKIKRHEYKMVIN